MTSSTDAHPSLQGQTYGIPGGVWLLKPVPAGLVIRVAELLGADYTWEVPLRMTAEQMVQMFLRHRQITVQFADLMPDEHFHYKPWDGSLSFGQQALHLATAGDFYLSFVDGTPVNRPDPPPTAPADIRAFLARKTVEQAERIGSVGADLNRLIAFRDKQVPLFMLLGQMREHEAHHKGQMMQMLRMIGIRDPLFYAVR